MGKKGNIFLLIGWLVAVAVIVVSCIGSDEEIAVVIGIPLLIAVWAAQYKICGNANPFHIFKD